MQPVSKQDMNVTGYPPVVFEPEVELKSYWITILRHLRLIIFCILISVSSVVLRIQTQPDTFTAYTEILIENKGLTVGTGNQIYRVPDPIDASMIKEWLLSTPVMTKVQNLVGAEIGVGSGNYDIFFPIRHQATETSTQLLVGIMATASHAQHSYLMAESIVRAFRSQLMDNQLQQTRESLSWMAERLSDQKKKVEEAELRFQEYKQKIMVVSFEEQQRSESAMILSASTELNQLANQRLQQEVELAKLIDSKAKGESFSDLSFISQNVTSVAELIAEWNKLKADLEDSLRIFKEKHPKIEEIQSQMATLRTRIESEKANTITSIQIKIQTLKDREKVLEKSISDYKDSAQEVSQKEWQYRVLEREVQTNSELYNSLLSELESTDLRGKIESTTVTVIEPAVEPRGPDSKQVVRNVVIGLLIGALAGLILAFIIDYFESTFRTPEDVERRLGIPVVGMIPERE